MFMLCVLFLCCSWSFCSYSCSQPMPEEIVQEGIGTDAKAPKLNEEAVRKHSVTANVHDRQVVDVNGQEAVRCGDVLFRVIPASFGK